MNSSGPKTHSGGGFMAKKNKTSKSFPLPILIIVCAVLLYAIYTSISTLVLAIWGNSVMGTVDSYSSRLNDRNTEQNRYRTVSKLLVYGKWQGDRGYVNIVVTRRYRA